MQQAGAEINIEMNLKETNQCNINTVFKTFGRKTTLNRIQWENSDSRKNTYTTYRTKRHVFTQYERGEERR